jgi:predicted dehydrogenase
MEKIKLGVIGLGPRGTYLFGLAAKDPAVVPAAVCDLIPEKMDAMCERLAPAAPRKYTDYREMLASDIDAVIVATGVDTHADIAADCLYAKKHVLCEIPNIASVEQAKTLLTACRENPEAKFMVAENCCYWAFIQSWKKMYEDGMLGDIVFAEADYLHEARSFMPEDSLTWRSHMPAVTYLTHDLGPLLYILGDTCDEISGFTPGINPISSYYIAPPNGVCMVKTKKGTLIKIFIGFGMRHCSSHNFILYGSKGSVENERHGDQSERKTIATLDCIPNMHSREVTLPLTTGFPGADKSGHGGADSRMMNDFVRCIVKDTPPTLGIEFGLNIALPGILADKSSRESGKMYKMPSIAEILGE